MHCIRAARGAKRVVLVVLFWALVACRPGPAGTQVADDAEATQKIAITSTLALSPTPTVTPSPTRPTPTKTPTATAAPTNTPAPPTQDPNLALTQAVESLMTQGSPRVLQTSNSPDGAWRVEVARYECRKIDEEGEKAFEILKLIEIASGKEATVDTQLQNCGGVGAFGLGFSFWAGDGQSLYYTTARDGTPDGLCGYWEPSLIQFRLANQARADLSLGPLSPDQTRMAFAGSSSAAEITLWDLNSGQLGRAPVMVGDGYVQGIAWAPDGRKLAYLQVEGVCGPPGLSTIIVLDVGSFQQEVLFTSASPGFREIAWNKPDEIGLVDENGALWTLSVSNVALVPN